MSATECLEHSWLSEDLPRLTMPNNAFKDCSDLLDNNFTTNETSIAHNGTNGVAYHNKYNSVNESDDEHIDADAAVQSNKDYNKENILGNSNHSKFSIQTSSITAASGVLNGSVTPTTTVSISEFIFEDRNDDLLNPTITTSTITINPCDINRHQSSQMSLFPDAPTTPKVCRKSSPDSPPSVKALVKKFQLENSDAIATPSTNGTNGHSDGNGTNCEEDFCSARCSVNCMPCGPGCRHLNGRKSIGIDQGIIC